MKARRGDMGGIPGDWPWNRIHRRMTIRRGRGDPMRTRDGRCPARHAGGRRTGAILDRKHRPGIRRRARIPADRRGGKLAGLAGRSERGKGGTGRPRQAPRGRRPRASPSSPMGRAPGYRAVASCRRERSSGRAHRPYGPAGPPAPQEARPSSPGEGRSSRTRRCNRRTYRIESARQGGRRKRPRRPPLWPVGRNRR